jgi:integrase
MRRDYLLQRPGSQNWRVRLQDGGKAVEHSLGTPDRALAELRALPLIAAHKEKLLAKRPALTPAWQHELEPNREHAGPDGGKIVATDTLLIHINHNGAVIKTEPNGRQAFALVGGPLTLRSYVEAVRDHFDVIEGVSRPGVATKNGDDDLIELYLRERNITGPQEKQCRETWSLFKELCPGVKLKDATRDHGRILVAHLRAMKGRTGAKVKSTTVMHKIAQLCAACNFGIAEGKLRFNPFAAIASKGDDVTKRLKFTDADMKLIWDNLDSLPASDQLLVRVLASTGMRLDEAFQIDGEEEPQQGIRHVIVGTKTEQSERRVPFPATLLPYLPETVKGRLFSGPSHNASSRLNPWLERIGIVSQKANTAKSVHSFRHRAKDRLRIAQCKPDSLQWAVLGHEKKTVAAGYGEGYPVTVLKQWIDEIGM